MSDRALKTEKPTPRRIEKARREGQFVVARQLVGAGQFVACVALLEIWGARWFQETAQSARIVLTRAFSSDLGAGDLVHLSTSLLWRAFWPLAQAGALLVAVSLAIQLAVSRMGVSLKKLTPDLKRLSPLARLRELPRQNLPAFLQASVMLPLFGAVIYFIAADSLTASFGLPLAGLAAGVGQVGASLLELLWKSSAVFLVFGLVDLVRQRLRYERDLRMSKQEIREEIKELEGNPQIKARIRRLGRELLRRHMMREVPKATAVIVNPTHYAVAIRYRMQSMAAPVVVAKGKNYLAQRIRKKALEHQVPLVENAPLAQALYKSAEVGQEIPMHLYRAVAEVLAYIYRMMNGRLPGA